MRGQIVACYKDLLESVTPGKVYGRVHPLTPDTMPGCCVYWQEEAGTREAAPHGSTTRQLTVVVEVYLEGVDVDDALDALAVQIEQLVFADQQCGGIAVLGSAYDGARIETGPATERMQYSKLAVQFIVIYRTLNGDAEHGI